MAQRIQAAVVASIEQVETKLRRRAEDADAGGNVRAGSGQKIPPGYIDATVKYFEQISKGTAKK